MICDALTGKNENWHKFITFYLPQWGDYFPLWLLVDGTTHSHPVHVVKFEDLKSNTSVEVGKILNFLGFPFNEEELAETLNKKTSDATQRYYITMIQVNCLSLKLSCLRNLNKDTLGVM